MSAATDYRIPDMSPELARGPVWLQRKRSEARESFNGSPLPPRGLHLWRYTDPSRFLYEKAQMADTSFGENYDAVERLELRHLNDGHIAALVTDLGGRTITVHGQDYLSKRGIIVLPLSTAVEQHAALVEPYLYRLVNANTGKFEAMNGALWNDGIFIHVPDNCSLEKPIHLLREAGRERSAQFPRLLVVVGQSAELTLIDEYGGGATDRAAGASHSNGAVEIFGGTDSRTRYVSLQRQTSAMNSYLTHRARLDRGATMLTMALVFGANLCKQNFGVILDGPGAESTMYGLLFGSDHQQFDNHTLHHHASGRTKSNIDFKVVLRDKAISAYTGLIRIEHNAEVCEAYQENRNMLLNPGTRAESIPELEILNEEVTCTHGATVGPIDPMQLFYLNSRGIDKTEAVRMVVSGFVASTFRLVPDDLRERITDFVAQRLENL
ncbi:MAG: SufD family Fe-S cluster assembly protein [Candidatus Zixiibacteriota bacterium]